MKSVGIVTFHRANHYGVFLQAYATFSFMNANGYNAQIVDYTNSYEQRIQKWFVKKVFPMVEDICSLTVAGYRPNEELKKHAEKKALSWSIPRSQWSRSSKQPRWFSHRSLRAAE